MAEEKTMVFDIKGLCSTLKDNNFEENDFIVSIKRDSSATLLSIGSRQKKIRYTIRVDHIIEAFNELYV